MLSFHTRGLTVRTYSRRCSAGFLAISAFGTTGRQGRIPWNYLRFLDAAADRVFLRKVGAGYIFVHRMLLDYFAHHGIAGSDAPKKDTGAETGFASVT